MIPHPPISTDSHAGAGWQPIETAPTGVDEILVYCADTEDQFVAYCDGSDRSLYCFATMPGGRQIMCEPTHWMPLPPHPTLTEQGER